MLSVEKICIVCGEVVWWDNSPLPPACADHPYREVFEAQKAAQQSVEPTVCTECDDWLPSHFAHCSHNPD
jgi:hypothetical protein